MTVPETPERDTIPALRVRQWLDAWDEFKFDEGERQARPEPVFYVLSMSAAKLRSLSGIQRRSVQGGRKRSEDLGVQRQHDRDRSEEIRRFVDGGFPWSSLGTRRLSDPDSDALRKPGWLPTAIVVNILKPGDERGGIVLDESQAVLVEDLNNGHANVSLPNPDVLDDLPPIEVIDGQHRLFAFESEDAKAQEYDLPVVAFVGLDLSWQAYLFWTINIKPKRINASFAFDLYPLLREESWLEASTDIPIYRDTRAQELTEILWASKDSPWYQRINMLGGTRKGNGPVSQSAFVRSLTFSLVKPWRSHGLFGGTPDGIKGLAWSRPQQGAFLVTAWKLLAEAVNASTEPWATTIRDSAHAEELSIGQLDDRWSDPAFTSSDSLLATDQGVRAFLQVLNDAFYSWAVPLNLKGWSEPDSVPSDTVEAVAEVLPTVEGEPFFDRLREITRALADFDWRSASAPGLEPDEKRRRAALRGSGGYKILRTDLIKHLERSPVEALAHEVRLLELS